MADLSVGSLSWSQPVKAGDGVGKTAILNITVQNNGKGAAAASRLDVTCTPLSGVECPPDIDKRFVVGVLAPGAKTTLAWPDPSAAVWSAGLYRITAAADNSRQVTETNDGDNLGTIDFTVGTGAPFRKNITLPEKVKQVNPVEKKAINPQPEPPGKALNVKKTTLTSPAAMQPLAGTPGVGFVIDVKKGHLEKISAQTKPVAEVQPAEKEYGTAPGMSAVTGVPGGPGAVVPLNPGRIEGKLYGKVEDKSVPQLAGGCENVSVTFFDQEDSRIGSVAAFEGDGANCRYEYYTTFDTATLRVVAWIGGHMSEWAYHEDPSHVEITNRTVNAELKTLSPAITAQLAVPNFTGVCTGSRVKGRLYGTVGGKGPDQWFGCQNIRIEGISYNGESIGTTQAVPDGSGKNCRYCFEYSNPNYLIMRPPYFIGDYNLEWKVYNYQMNEENGIKTLTRDAELKEVRDLTSDQKPDLELKFIKIASPDNFQSDIETSLKALDPADFIYKVTNRGVSRSKPFKVVLSFGDIPIVSNEHAELDPGQSSNTIGTTHAVWPHILCNAPVSLTVDPDNRVAETDENNNVWNHTLPCASESSPYDLKMIFLHQEPVEQSLMTPVRFVYAVANEGYPSSSSSYAAATTGAPPSKLSIKVYKYADHSLLGETTVDIPAIPLGTQYNGEFYAFVTARSDYATLYIDPDNTIPEKRLQNNRIKPTAAHVTFVP